MFSSQSNGLPVELILKILNELPLEDAIKFLTVSKEMHRYIKDNSIWQKFGVNNFTEFATRMSALPIFFQRAIIDRKYDFKTCEKVTLAIYSGNGDVIAALRLLLPPEYSKHHFMNPYPIFRILMPEYKTVIPNDLIPDGMNQNMQRAVAIGFLELLISPQQMKNLQSSAIYDLFLQDGIKALQNKLITPEEAAKIIPSQLGWHLSQLVSEFEANKSIDEPPSKKPHR